MRAGFSFSPDSSQIVYRADQDVNDTPEIYLANIATPGTSQQLNPELTAGGEVSTAYHFSPDGANVGYIADQEVDERQELFVVSVATPGVSTKLNGPMTAEGDLCRFEFSHDSTRVAYCGDQETDEVMELFLVSLDAPGVSQKLNPTLVSGGNVGSELRLQLGRHVHRLRGRAGRRGPQRAVSRGPRGTGHRDEAQRPDR